MGGGGGGGGGKKKKKKKKKKKAFKKTADPTSVKDPVSCAQYVRPVARRMPLAIMDDAQCVSGTNLS